MKSELKQGVYGRVRVVEGFKDYGRLYVKKTNLRTYVLSTSETLSFDSMVEVNGNYHFGTLKELHAALIKV